MNLHKNLKIIVLLVGSAVQGILISQLTGAGCDNVFLQIAGEVPEPGSILLFAFGSLWLRKQNRKNRRQL